MTTLPDRDFVIAELERMIGDSLVGRAAIALISAQAPKPASAGGAEACLAAAMVEGIDEAIANGDIERIRDIWNRRLGAIAAEADTAKTQRCSTCGDWIGAGGTGGFCVWKGCPLKDTTSDRLAPIEAHGAVTDGLVADVQARMQKDGMRAASLGTISDVLEAFLRARESAPAVEPIPDGWVLVPREPTGHADVLLELANPAALARKGLEAK